MARWNRQLRGGRKKTLVSVASLCSSLWTLVAGRGEWNDEDDEQAEDSDVSSGEELEDSDILSKSASLLGTQLDFVCFNVNFRSVFNAYENLSKTVFELFVFEKRRVQQLPFDFNEKNFGPDRFGLLKDFWYFYGLKFLIMKYHF